MLVGGVGLATVTVAALCASGLMTGGSSISSFDVILTSRSSSSSTCAWRAKAAGCYAASGACAA